MMDAVSLMFILLNSLGHPQWDYIPDDIPFFLISQGAIKEVQIFLLKSVDDMIDCAWRCFLEKKRCCYLYLVI